MTQRQLPDDIHQWLVELTRDPNLKNYQLVQSLWSDFGQLLRCYSPARQSSLIIKLIASPASFKHPRGWNSSHSQQRKWRSYQIEQHFYAHYSDQLDDNMVARLIGSEQRSGQQAIVLTDLDEKGFPLRLEWLDANRCTGVLEWLAKFHATFMHQAPQGLWTQGSYWHLATREDEWNSMPESKLKANAAKLDAALRHCPYQTLIHGDAKVANFCFTPDATQVAAVDFQYVGGGIGVQDVAYFIGSALTEQEQRSKTEHCLDIYFEALSTHLRQKYNEHEVQKICQCWRELYPVANADFHRFLAGWSPAHYKINDVLETLTDQALDTIERQSN